MPKLSKAKRGKNRWIGLSVTNSPISRSELCQLLDSGLQGTDWKLYDYEEDVSKGTAIVRVMLEDVSVALERINSIKGLSTVTTSGKIRLVRERLSLV